MNVHYFETINAFGQRQAFCTGYVSGVFTQDVAQIECATCVQAIEKRDIKNGIIDLPCEGIGTPGTFTGSYLYANNTEFLTGGIYAINPTHGTCTTCGRRVALTIAKTVWRHLDRRMIS